MKLDLLFFCLLLGIFFIFGEEQVSRKKSRIPTQTFNCNWTNPKTGDTYDLSPLTNNNYDYFQNVTAKKWWVWINICRPVLVTQCGTSDGGIAACQQWDSNLGKAILGLGNTVIYSALPTADKGVVAQYSQGAAGRQFELSFWCTPHTGLGSPVFQVEQPPNYYRFDWETEYACPLGFQPPNSGGGKKLSIGSILLIVLLVLVVIYISAGITYNRIRKQKSGFELIPNVDLWTSLPGLVKDGVFFIISKTCRRNGYSQV